MQKQAPTIGRLLTMTLFALSCFGLLLFLWLAFGGPVPLKPKGYEFKVSFGEATQLAQEADVRISGVPVGKVKKIVTNKQTEQVGYQMTVTAYPDDANNTVYHTFLTAERQEDLL